MTTLDNIGRSSTKIKAACDVLVIGGGPAGLAAAMTASSYGLQVIIIDDNPQLGGQIWRGSDKNNDTQTTTESTTWGNKWLNLPQQVEVIKGASVFHANFDAWAAQGYGLVFAESDTHIYEIRCQTLILATGGREQFIPFPGWTLPGVLGAGGLQALVKGGLPIQGKRVILAGTGPLLLAVAAYLKEKGAQVCLIAEQAPWHKLNRFAAGLIRQPQKVVQFLNLQRLLLGVPYQPNSWPAKAHGSDKLTGVTITRNGAAKHVDCDYLGITYYLVPNIELAAMLGCEIRQGAVVVDELQQTSQPAIYAVGELTGIGGVERSMIEGKIAGYAVAKALTQARELFAEHKRQHQFSQDLGQTFSLRPELKTLASPDTIVCRCEDVTHAHLEGYISSREAKLHTRCGMGPCQGRVCGPITSFLYDWQDTSIRPPSFPVSVASLMALSSTITNLELPQKGDNTL
jgi:D-hydroxyproline dehydrogenase subunit alpha